MDDAKRLEYLACIDALARLSEIRQACPERAAYCDRRERELLARAEPLRLRLQAGRKAA